MRTALVATLAAGLLAASSAAWSQDSKFYAGLSIGQSKDNQWCSDVPSGISCDDKDTAWKLFAGYRFHPNFAVELGYNDLGTVKGGGTDAGTGLAFDASVDTTAWELTGIGSWPLANRFAVYGKLGLYYGESKGHVNIAGLGSGSAKETNTDLTFGLGASYDLTRNASLRIEWQRFNDVGGSDLGGTSDIDVFSIGALYRF